MGDASTHLIFFSGYWYLVYADTNIWYDTKEGHENPVCAVGEEEKILDLKEVN